MTTDLTAELKRRTQGGQIADWTLTPDVDSPNGLSDPMADYGARERLEDVKASVDSVVAELQTLTVSGDITVTDGATETTLVAALSELEAISTTLGGALTVTGAVSVTNHPSQMSLPGVQVADLKQVEVTNQPADYPLPAAQFEALKPPTSQPVTGNVDVGNFPAEFPAPATVSRINVLIDAVADVEAAIGPLLRPGGSVDVGNLPTDFPDTGTQTRLDDVKTKLDAVNAALAGLLKPGQAIEVSNFPVDPETGNWDYLSGTAGTGIAPAGRVLTISAVALSPGATLTINGGTPIPILPRFPFTITPKGNMASPTLDFAGTDAYFVEYVS